MFASLVAADVVEPKRDGTYLKKESAFGVSAITEDEFFPELEFSQKELDFARNCLQGNLRERGFSSFDVEIGLTDTRNRFMLASRKTSMKTIDLVDPQRLARLEESRPLPFFVVEEFARKMASIDDRRIGIDTTETVEFPTSVYNERVTVEAPFFTATAQWLLALLLASALPLAYIHHSERLMELGELGARQPRAKFQFSISTKRQRHCW